MSDAPFEPALQALADCGEALDKLDRLCCEPGRSPQMQELSATISKARAQVERLRDRPDHARSAIASLEDAGSQVGRLQVGCCAPGRLPLYTRLLTGLTTAQLSINEELGTGH